MQHVPVAPVTSRLPYLQSWVSDRDETRTVTYLALGGIAAAVMLALIGGFPINMPMPTMAFGWVTPTCGLTRGSTALARGDFALAWHYNPASFLVMGYGVYGIARFVGGTITGRWVNLRVRGGRYGGILLVVAFVALGAYQQMHADFIIHSRL